MKTLKTLLASLIFIASLSSCSKDNTGIDGHLINIKGGDFANYPLNVAGNWLYYTPGFPGNRYLQIDIINPAETDLKVTFKVVNVSIAYQLYFFIPKGTSKINELVINNSTYDDLQFVSITKANP